MAISLDELQAAAAQARRAAAAAGELHPPHVGPITTDLPDTVRQAVSEDIASGTYERAAIEATAGDPELAQH